MYFMFIFFLRLNSIVFLIFFKFFSGVSVSEEVCASCEMDLITNLKSFEANIFGRTPLILISFVIVVFVAGFEFECVSERVR